MAKREDVRKRLLERRDKDEVVVKCCLSSRLKESQIKQELQNRILNTAKIVHRGSLIFNRLLLHCFTTNITLPDLNDLTLYRQCFVSGIEQNKTTQKFSALKHVYITYFSTFPKPERHTSDSNSLVYAAKKYMTNFKTMLATNFEKRQKKFLYAYCEKNGIEISQVR